VSPPVEIAARPFRLSLVFTKDPLPTLPSNPQQGFGPELYLGTVELCPACLKSAFLCPSAHIYTARKSITIITNSSLIVSRGVLSWNRMWATCLLITERFQACLF